jgi:rhodanese-related sulfurtransferase
MKTLQFESSISAGALRQLMAAGPVQLLDVRTPGEFAAGHVPNARLIPLGDLDPAAFLRETGVDGGPVYVICQGGTRARKAMEKFQRAGFNRCVLVEGGTQGWIDAGLPVVRGASKTLPLMRQVQLAVGAISAAGAALALLVNYHFAIIPLITGCGLLFAGLTGICGLALLLAKLPWNRAADGATVTCCNNKG